MFTAPVQRVGNHSQMRSRKQKAESRKRVVPQVLCCLLSAVCCLANARAEELTLPRANGAITLDGDLSDAAWNNALVISKFYEYYKSDNTEPPMQTIARVMYDD